MSVINIDHISSRSVETIEIIRATHFKYFIKIILIYECCNKQKQFFCLYGLVWEAFSEPNKQRLKLEILEYFKTEGFYFLMERQSFVLKASVTV